MAMVLVDNVRLALRKDRRLVSLGKGYLVFLALVLVSIGWAAHLPADGATPWDNYWIGLCASFCEDLVFFTVLGAVSIVVTLAKPEDDELSQRVKYVYNGIHLSEGAHAYLQEKMEELAPFSPSYNLLITLGDYDAALDAVKATVLSERRLVNTFTERVLRGVVQWYKVGTDQVGSADQLQGEVWSVTVDGRDLVRGALPVRGARFAREEKLTIPANGQVAFTYKFWVWFKVGQAYTFDPQRYTEQVRVTVVNDSGCSMVIVPGATLDSDRTPVTLTKGQSRPYSRPNLRPGETELFTLKELV